MAKSIEDMLDLMYGRLPQRPVVPGGVAADTDSIPGLRKPGNIDLAHRPTVKNADGSISTVRSISVGTDDGEVLIPTVVGDRVVSDSAAVDHYKKTGEHLGIFNDPASATAYAQRLHEQQAAQYARPDPVGDVLDSIYGKGPSTSPTAPTPPPVMTPAPPPPPADAPPETTIQHLVGSLQQLGQRITEAAQNLMAPPPPPAIDQHALELAAQFRDQTGVGAQAPAMPPLTTPPMQERPDAAFAQPALPPPPPPAAVRKPLPPSVAKDAQAAEVAARPSEHPIRDAALESFPTLVGAGLSATALASLPAEAGITATAAAGVLPFVAADLARGIPLQQAMLQNLGGLIGMEAAGKVVGKLLGPAEEAAFPQGDPHASRGQPRPDYAQARAITDMRVAHAPEPTPEPVAPEGPVARNAQQPERIVAATVRNSKGQEFDGPIHAAARDAAYQQGALEDKMVDGFRTSEGRFVDRFEARKIAENAGQAAPDDNRLIAEDVRKRDPSFGLTPEQDQERQLTEATAHTQDIVLRQKRSGSSVTDMTTGQPAPVENAPIVTATYAGVGDSKFLPRQVIEDFTREHADKLFDGEHVLTTSEPRPGEYELGVAPKTAPVADGPAAPASEPVPEAGAKLKMPVTQVRDQNFLVDLSEHADRAYRESSPNKALEMLPNGGVMTDTPEVFMANTPNLARGQGNNHGVSLEFDTDGLQGVVNTRKPGWETAYQNGEAELVGRYNKQTQYQDALRSVTVEKSLPNDGSSKRLVRALDDLTQQGWTRESLDNGRVRYTRPETPAKRPLIPFDKAPQELRDEYLGSLEGNRSPAPQATDVVSRSRTDVPANEQPPVELRRGRPAVAPDISRPGERGGTDLPRLPARAGRPEIVGPLPAAPVHSNNGLMAAVQVGDRVYTGPIHTLAVRNAVDDGALTEAQALEQFGSRRARPDTEGFVDKNGRWWSRADARADLGSDEALTLMSNKRITSVPGLVTDDAPPALGDVLHGAYDHVVPRPLAARGAGALGGAAIGYTTGDTPEEKARNAAVGAAAGLGLELGLGAVTKPAATAAEETANALNAVMDAKARLRQYGGERARMTDITAEAVKDHTARWAAIADKAESANPRISGPARQAHVDFIDRIETGQGNALPPKDQKLGEILREQLDVRTSELLKRGLLGDAIDDYMPRLFKQGNRPAIGQLLGRRPLQGATGFLKSRSYDLYKDAIAAGHEPITWDPIQQTLLKIRQMDKYIAFDDLKTELKDKGVIESYGNGRVPSGMVPLNDRALSGYAAPPEVAKVFNNFTANSALQDEGWFKSMRAASNHLNQIQLLGAFHAGFVGLESVVSQTARGFEAASNGEFGKAIGALSRAPVAPVVQILKGSKVLGEWLKPGSFPEFADIVNAGELAGGRARMDKTFATNFVRNMVGAAREGTAGGYLRAAGWMFPAGVESAMAPLMEHAVPRIKLASFADLMGDELERLGPAATQEQVRASAQKVWDSVDNRFGQLVYDNLFMNRTVKDIAQLGVRSVGWNAGTIRELGGGALDLPELITKGKLTHRAAYFLSLNTVVPLMGGTMTYLMTGEAPQELKDYYFPRTGRLRPDGSPDRLSLPSYAKDEFAYALHPVRTALSKAGPIARVMQDLYSNQDFYGVQVRDPDAPWQVQAKEIADYAKGQVVPFSVRGFTKLGEYGESPLRRAGALVGVNPAPAEITRSSFQNLLNERYADTFPSGARTQAQADASHRRAQAVYDIRQGKEPDLTGFSHTQVGHIRSQAKIEPDEYKFSHLSLPQQLKLWDEATPEERTKNHLAKHILSGTLAERLGNLPVEERLTVRGRLAEVRKFAQDTRSRR